MRGNGILVLLFKIFFPVLQLTLAEIEKKERRKEQNRRAARKCRIKKRAQNVTMASVSFTFVVEVFN